MNELIRSDLQRLLTSLEGQPSTEYNRLIGSHQYDDFTLRVDHVPDQPELHPCRMRVAVPLKTAKFPYDVFSPKSREIAARDFLARQFSTNAASFSAALRGMTGGVFEIERPGQEILETNAVVLGDDYLEARFSLLMPVIRNRVPKDVLFELFMKRLPGLIRQSFTYDGSDRDGLVRWIEVNEDSDALRGMLAQQGLVAFIADGSILAWKGPHERRSIVPLVSPKELAVTLTLPNRGAITGMGIPKGITVLSGGWHQGKTTLLKALGVGVYNHMPGDGRELAVSVPDAVMIRVEEGRRVERVDITPILPPDPGTRSAPFSTSYATPAVSLAVNIMEALEIGTSLLLFDDEDATPTLFGSDAVSRKLMEKCSPPRTLTDILPLLRDQHGISSIVTGSSQELFEIADRVILMDHFVPRDATSPAKEIMRQMQCVPAHKPEGAFPLPRNRAPLSRNLEPPKRERKIQQPQGRDIVQYGDEYLDLSGLTQLVSKGQVRAIGRAISLVDRLLDGSPSLKDAIQKVMTRISQVGLDTLSNKQMGDLASFRAQELAGAINRMKQLKIK